MSEPRPLGSSRESEILRLPGVKTRPVHQYSFDLETQGLRLKQDWPGGVSASNLSGKAPIGISSISYGRMGKRAKVNAFTDIVDPAMLRRHGVTLESLQAGGMLPETLASELSFVYDAAKHTRTPWDPSVGVHGSPLNKIFRSHAEFALGGNKEGYRGLGMGNVSRKLIRQWEGISRRGGIVELGSWNIGYDASVLFGELRKHGYGDRLDNLIKGDSIRVRELADDFNRLRFRTMLSGNLKPYITDRAALEAGVLKGAGDATFDQMRRLGVLKENTGLEAFFSDLRQGESAFKARAQNWVARRTDGSIQAQRVAGDMANRMSKIKTYDDFLGWVGEMQKSSTERLFGNRGAYSILQEMFGFEGRTHVLGDIETFMGVGKALGQTSPLPITHGLTFTGGAKLDQVSWFLATEADKLGVSKETAAELARPYVHEAASDRSILDIVYRETKRIASDEKLVQAFQESYPKRYEEMMAKRGKELWADYLRGPAGQAVKHDIPTAATGGMRWSKIMEGMKGKWAMAGLAAAGLYLMGRRNEEPEKIEETDRIEGMRQAKSSWLQMDGIDPSNLPFANLSAFGSGYDQFYGSVIRPEKVRISRVLDGDTVEFYRDGRPVVARLAGVDTPETKHPHKPIEAMGRQAAAFLREMLEGQEVWLRTQALDRMDKYGRELVYLDINGVSANAAIAQAGLSKTRSRFPTPYFEGSEVVGLMKFRMKEAVGRITEWVGSLFGRDGPPPDPALWVALAMGVSPGEEADITPEMPQGPTGYGGVARRQFHMGGQAGYLQMLSRDTIGHGIRDHATQLHRLPAMPRTYQGSTSVSMNSYSESMAYQDAREIAS